MSRLVTMVAFIGLTVLATGFALAQDSEQTRSTTENTRAAEQILQANTSVAFFEERCQEVLLELGEEMELKFLLHESARDNQLDEDTLITFRMSDVRRATMLDLMLDPYDCTYTIKDGIVIILSQDEALDNLSMRVFDCRELIAKIEPKQERRYLSGSFGGGGFGGGGGGLGGGQFSIDPGVQQQQTAQGQEAKAAQATPPSSQVSQPRYEIVETSPTEQLYDLILALVDPDSWEENGGSGRFQEINGLLVVSQTDENHQRIRVLLDELRSKLQ